MVEKKKERKLSALFVTRKSANQIDSQVAFLVKSAAELRMEIEKQCPHEYTIEVDGYDGRNSGDEDNSYPARRFCLMCEIAEQGEDARDTRVIQAAFKEYSCDGDWLFKNLLAKPQYRVAGEFGAAFKKLLRKTESLEEMKEILTEKNYCYKWFSNMEIQHNVAKASEKAQEESLKTYEKVLNKELGRGKK